jgi:hypothetical protein
MYAIHHGLDEELSVVLISVVLVVVALSIVLPGTTARLFMSWYSSRSNR